MELADLRYRGGVACYLEVLDARRGLFNAELGLSQAQLLELAAAVQTYKALGGSWDSGGWIRPRQRSGPTRRRYSPAMIR